VAKELPPPQHLHLLQPLLFDGYALLVLLALLVLVVAPVAKVGAALGTKQGQ
jgi:hypothetical protein